MAILTAKIIAMALMGIFTLFFGLLPLKVKSMILKGEPHSRQRRKRELIISALLCFGSGVLIATVFVHMIPEAREGFERSLEVLNKRHSEPLTSFNHGEQGHPHGEDGYPHEGEDSHGHVEDSHPPANGEISHPHGGEDDHHAHDHGEHGHKEESAGAMAPNNEKPNVEHHNHDHNHMDAHDHAEHSNANETDDHADHEHHEINEKINATDGIHDLHGHEHHDHDAHLHHNEPIHEIDSMPEASQVVPEDVKYEFPPHAHEHDEVGTHNNENLENESHPHESHVGTHLHESHVGTHLNESHVETHPHESHIVTHPNESHIETHLNESHVEAHPNENDSSHNHDHRSDEGITHTHEVTDTTRSQPQGFGIVAEPSIHDHAHDNADDTHNHNEEHASSSTLEPQHVEDTTAEVGTSTSTYLRVEDSTNTRVRRSAFVREDSNDTHKEGEVHDHDHHAHDDHDHEGHANESNAHDDHANEGIAHDDHANEGIAHDDHANEGISHDDHAHDDHGHDDHGHDDHGHGYPLAELMVCLGFFLIYTIEEVLHKILFRHSHDSENNNDLDKSGKGNAEDGHRHNHHSHIPPFHSNSSKNVHTSPHNHTNGDVYSTANKNQINGHVSSRNVQETTFKTMSPRAEWGVQGVENPVFAGDIEATSWNPKLRNSITLTQVAPITSPEVQVRSYGTPSTPTPKLDESFPEISKDDVIKKGMFTHILTNIRSLLIIVALSFHSIFEGMAVGLQEVKMDVWYLFLAISAHKFVIVFCIGLELLESKTPLVLMILYMFVLALVTPIGIGISIIITENSTFGGAEHTLIIAILQGIAGGTLLYVAFLEILERERSKPGGRLVKLISVFLGFALMASLEAAGGGHSHAPIEGH